MGLGRKGQWDEGLMDEGQWDEGLLVKWDEGQWDEGLRDQISKDSKRMMAFPEAPDSGFLFPFRCQMLEASDSLLLWSILVQFLCNTGPNPLLVAFPPPVVVACSVLVQS